MFEALSYDRETIRIQGYGMMSLNLLSISQQHFVTPLLYLHTHYSSLYHLSLILWKDLDIWTMQWQPNHPWHGLWLFVTWVAWDLEAVLLPWDSETSWPQRGWNTGTATCCSCAGSPGCGAPDTADTRPLILLTHRCGLPSSTSIYHSTRHEASVHDGDLYFHFEKYNVNSIDYNIFFC